MEDILQSGPWRRLNLEKLSALLVIWGGVPPVTSAKRRPTTSLHSHYSNIMQLWKNPSKRINSSMQWSIAFETIANYKRLFSVTNEVVTLNWEQTWHQKINPYLKWMAFDPKINDPLNQSCEVEFDNYILAANTPPCSIVTPIYCSGVVLKHGIGYRYIYFTGVWSPRF